ncbi:MAG: hypothetical protein ACR2OZ_07530 [Verrucomicrobiales bacterium]
MRGLFQLCLVLARSILGDMRARRQWMFFSTLAVLAFVFGGYFLLLDFLQRHPWWFAIYLAASFAGLAFVMVFALFDFLAVRKAFAEARKAAFDDITRGISDHDAQEGPPGS